MACAFDDRARLREAGLSLTTGLRVDRALCGGEQRVQAKAGAGIAACALRSGTSRSIRHEASVSPRAAPIRTRIIARRRRWVPSLGAARRDQQPTERLERRQRAWNRPRL
ncbi:MAG: hypothetical protein NVV68_05130 [Dokdonella sp.]|nr:hypothetical protein [Dokdonella sp.]